jgi:uncharacterized protein (DUF362 family)
MTPYTVSVVRYRQPVESVKSAVDRSDGLAQIGAGTRVFIKPNIVFWTRATAFPKWGVITTSRVVQDMVRLLVDRGVSDITIGEGMVTRDPRDVATPAHAFETLGYNDLKRRYGVKVVNVFERPFEPVDLGDDIGLNFNTDILHSDLVVDLPVMKAHNQTVVSLGIKNLKGTIDIASRKRCHSPDPIKNLDCMVARLADRLPPIFTLIDGIYSLERGPGPDGSMRRSDILVASNDILSADMVGARLLGYAPRQVPHLALAAANRGRPADLSDIAVIGESIEDLASPHRYDFPYTSDEHGELPLPLAKQGIQGVFYRKYDDTMCTYCSQLNGLTLSAIRFAWKGQAWDSLEVLTGKRMDPTPGMCKTLLLGKCMYRKHKDNPDINEMIAVKGCPPKPSDVVKALRQAGIEADAGLFDSMDQLPGLYMARYQNRPEFEESFFRVNGER